MKKSFSTIVLIISLIVLLTACDSEPKTHTVTIDYDIDWLSPIELTVKDGDNLTRPIDPEKDEYEFDGWKTSDGKEFSFSTPITSDITITAAWLEKDCILIFKNKAGEIIKTDTVPRGIVYPLSTNLGYYVSSCTDDKGNSISIENDSITISKTETIIKITEKGEYLDYQIGDIGPAGGYIVFDADNYSSSNSIEHSGSSYSSKTLGFRYLEIASSDLPLTYVFGYYRTSDSDKNTSVNPDDDDHKKIGSGKSNTAELIKKMGTEAYVAATGETKTRYAALAAANYNGGGYSDWFLPSENELAILNVLDRDGKANIKAGTSVYWSSSESSATQAYESSIIASGPAERSSNYYVRPFRSF